MAKKKRENIEEAKEVPEGKSYSDSNRKMRPTEWAREEGLDPHLFLHWQEEVMLRSEYEKLKEKAM